MTTSVWYHGTDRKLDFLRAGSWVTNIPLEAALFAKLKCKDWRDFAIVQLEADIVPDIQISVSEGCHHATIDTDARIDKVWAIDNIAQLIDPKIVMPILMAESYSLLG